MTRTMPEYQPRYIWRPTGLGMEEDFCCHVDGRAVGRIYLANSLSEEGWYSSLYAHGPGIDRQGRKHSGHASTPQLPIALALLISAAGGFLPPGGGVNVGVGGGGQNNTGGINAGVGGSDGIGVSVGSGGISASVGGLSIGN